MSFIPVVGCEKDNMEDCFETPSVGNQNVLDGICVHVHINQSFVMRMCLVGWVSFHTLFIVLAMALWFLATAPWPLVLHTSKTTMPWPRTIILLFHISAASLVTEALFWSLLPFWELASAYRVTVVEIWLRWCANMVFPVFIVRTLSPNASEQCLMLS